MTNDEELAFYKLIDDAKHLTPQKKLDLQIFVNFVCFNEEMEKRGITVDTDWLIEELFTAGIKDVVTKINKILKK